MHHMNSKIEIGIVTALPKEFAAMATMLDKHQDERIESDPMTYRVGSIGTQRVALTLLPKMGLEPAATIATHLIRSFRGIRDVLMVGIAGGVPSPQKRSDHVRLGDIVVSENSGVLQFDFGKLEATSTGSSTFTLRSTDPPPSARMQQSVRLLESNRIVGARPWEELLKRPAVRIIGTRPDSSLDILYDSVNPNKVVAHPSDPDRRKDQPRVHFGVVGSSNTLLKDPRVRDRLRDATGVKAIEMEGAGIATATWVGAACGYLLIRGICDYCDSHKSDVWQNYAAGAAAAYAAALIASIPRSSPAPEPLFDNRVLIRQLRSILVQRFSMAELDILCSDISAEFENSGINERVDLELVGGNGKEQVALRLIQYVDRRGYLDYLVREVRKARPNAAFFS
jgi:nucleoside phosphorylase